MITAIAYRRTYFSAFACVSLLALASCGKSPASSSASQQDASGAQSTDDEAAILNAPQLQNPILVHLNPDAYSQAQQLSALNGTDPRQTYGAAYQTNDYAPCGSSAQDAEFRTIHVGIDLANYDPPSLTNALIKSGVYRFETYTIQYPNRTTNDNGTQNVFTCVIVADAMKQYLPPGNGEQDIHGGTSLVFARRSFNAWTYENRYETDMPGHGKVKVFAGTMDYKMTVSVPIGSYNGDGVGTVKAMLNPDTGKWEIISFGLQDPPLNFNQ